MIKQTFEAYCYQDINGRYLSYDEHTNSKRIITAENEDEVFILLSEMQVEDSELTVEERWSVFPINTN